MNNDQNRKRLGRGLAALIGDMDQQPERRTENPPPADSRIPIEFIGRNPHNPRRNFDPGDLDDLARSILQHGVVQPVVVRSVGECRYEIIAGERRWRAAQQAGLVDIPVLIRNVDDRTALEIAIVENVQRADLNPLEEAEGYDQLIAEHGYTQNNLGEIIGKSRSHVANTLRLLKLPEPVRALVSDGSLSAGHARAIAATSDPVGLARRIVAGGLSVREAERLANSDAASDGTGKGGRGSSAVTGKDPDTLALERRLGDTLGLRVTVNHSARGGHLRIDYSTLDQLEDICRRLGEFG